MYMNSDLSGHKKVIKYPTPSMAMLYMLLVISQDTEVKCRNTNLESEVNELKVHVAELCSQLKHGKAEKTVSTQVSFPFHS